MTPPPLRVVFMGTPQFAVPCLNALMDHPEIARVLAVYTQPDRPAGRGQKLTPSAVKLAAIELGLPVFQPENINKNDEPRRLSDIMADVVVVVAYAQFLGQSILNLPRFGCINVHASLLPKFRGAAPIQYALLAGEKVTGVTTMRLVQKMDAGPMLLQAEVQVSEETTSEELFSVLSQEGADLLIKTLKKLQNNELQEVPQDEAQATYATLLTKEMGQIDWGKSCSEISNQIRALTPWPGTYVKTPKGILKIHQAIRVDEAANFPEDARASTTFIEKSRLLVKCNDGWLSLLKVQPEGKRAMGIEEFLAGLQGEAFQIL